MRNFPSPFSASFPIYNSVKVLLHYFCVILFVFCITFCYFWSLDFISATIGSKKGKKNASEIVLSLHFVFLQIVRGHWSMFIMHEDHTTAGNGNEGS